MTIPAGVLTDAFTYRARVDSWLGARWLGQVPVAGGSVSWTTSQQVQGALSLSVPRVGAAVEGDNERDWAPSGPTSPLACFGQVLHVQVIVSSLVTGQTWTEPAGRFLITATDVDDDRVSVTGKSLLHRLEEDRFTSPMTPRPGGTMASEARRIMNGHAPLLIDRALTNRACPASMSWGESRIDALHELADAWPARVREGRDGIVRILPPLTAITTTPERALTDGQAGTVVGVKRSATRDQIYNRVVARGQEQSSTGQPTFQAIADQRTGPMRVGGPYGAVTRFFSSPLITSRATAEATARSILATSVRAQSTIPIDHAPDPTIDLDEPVEVRTHDTANAAHTLLWGRVTAMDWPLTHEGTARTDVAVNPT